LQKNIYLLIKQIKIMAKIILLMVLTMLITFIIILLIRNRKKLSVEKLATTTIIVVLLCSIFGVVKTIQSILKTETIVQINDSVIWDKSNLPDKTEILIESIAEIESMYDSLAVNKHSSARGYLQILTGTVKDINRIVKKEKFNCSLDPEIGCRFSKEKSIEMFHIYQRHYNRNGDIEKAIRIWNGGPSYEKEKTDEYYYKVITVYNRKIEEYKQKNKHLKRSKK